MGEALLEGSSTTTDGSEDMSDIEEILGGGGSLESGVEWTWSYPVRHLQVGNGAYITTIYNHKPSALYVYGVPGY